MLHLYFDKLSWVLLIILSICIDTAWSKNIKINDKEVIVTKKSKRQVECLKRCERIFGRMLHRENYDIDSLNKILTTTKDFNNVTNNRNICWEAMDLTDCLKHCSGIGGSASVNWLDSVTDRSTGTVTLAIPKYIIKQLPWFRPLLKRCLSFVESQKKNFLCISKYRSFMGLKCSGYKKEAEHQYRNIKSQKEYDETCRFIHYHQDCLSTTALEYCPKVKRLFNSQTIRKYFLSHILPDNDNKYDDEFLDNCKLKKYSFENVFFENEENGNNLQVTTNKYHITTKRSPKGIFLSTESLEEIPPNFMKDTYGRYSIIPGATTPIYIPSRGDDSTETYIGTVTDNSREEYKPVEYEINSGVIINHNESNEDGTLLPASYETSIEKDTLDVLPQDRPILDGKVYIKPIRHIYESRKDPDFDMHDTSTRNITFEDVDPHTIYHPNKKNKDNNQDRFGSYDYHPTAEEDEPLYPYENLITSPEHFALFVCISVFGIALLFYICLMCFRKRCKKNVRCGVDL